jgi:hypothetical protein
MELAQQRPWVAWLFPCLLYLATGLATGAQAWWVVSWAWLGRSPGLPELLALLGAVGLLAAAGLSLASPRRAAQVALVAALAVWPFYAATAWQGRAAARAGDQALEVVFVRWEPGAAPVVVAPSAGSSGEAFAHLTPEELARLHTLGVGGRLEVTEATVVSGRGSGAAAAGGTPRARVVVVLSEQLRTSPVALRVPDRTNLLYLQREADWLAFPSDAATLDRTVTLEVANHTRFHTWYTVDLATGARSGGTAIVWPEPPREPYK